MTVAGYRRGIKLIRRFLIPRLTIQKFWVQEKVGVPYKAEWGGDEDPGWDPEGDGQDSIRKGPAGLCCGKINA